MVFFFKTKPVEVPGLKKKYRCEITINTYKYVYFGIRRSGKEAYITDLKKIAEFLPWIKQYLQLEGVDCQTGVTRFYFYENSLHFLINGDIDSFRRYMPTITDEEVKEMVALAEYGLYKIPHRTGTEVEFFTCEGENTMTLYKKHIDALHIPERSMALIKQLELECMHH